MVDSVDESIFGLSGPLDESTLAPLSCFICRKRKVKCSRQLPSCSLCTRLSLECAYPTESQKPGPKKGANQDRKKRPRRDDPPHQLSSAAPAFGPVRPGAPSGDPLTDDVDFSWLFDPTVDWANLAVGGATAMPGQAPFVPLGDPAAGLPRPSADPLIMRLSRSLTVQPGDCQTLLDLYFDSFGSFTLFKRPTFEAKLLNLRNGDHLLGLVAAMFAFSARFWIEATSGLNTHSMGLKTSSPDDFWILATYYVDKSMVEYRDRTPPLIVLQAMILTTLYGLIRGATTVTLHASETMVRIATQLGLHKIDRHLRGKPKEAQLGVDPAVWSNQEEGRRAWWSIWELDIFSSTCRRLPPDIDWYRNDTLLPVEDDDWFHDRPQTSCFLEIDPMDRWKSLAASGNESYKAWYICVNSMMHSAFFVPKSLRRAPNSGPKTDTGDSRMRKEDFIWTTHLHSNALHCFSLALPRRLQYHGEFLSFDNNPLGGSSRQRDNGVYMIHLMTQFARFMMHHRTVFANTEEGDGHMDEDGLQKLITTTKQSSRSKPWRLYLDTANNALSVIRNSPPNHIQYVNPLIALVVWLPAAVMQAYQIVGTGLSEREEKLVRSSFEMLKSTFAKYIDYWKLPTALFDRLKQLDNEFDRLTDAKLTVQGYTYGGLGGMSGTPSTAQAASSAATPATYVSDDTSSRGTRASPSDGSGTLPDDLIQKMSNLEAGYNPMLKGFLDDIFTLPGGMNYDG